MVEGGIWSQTLPFASCCSFFFFFLCNLKHLKQSSAHDGYISDPRWSTIDSDQLQWLKARPPHLPLKTSCWAINLVYFFGFHDANLMCQLPSIITDLMLPFMKVKVTFYDIRPAIKQPKTWWHHHSQRWKVWENHQKKQHPSLRTVSHWRTGGQKSEQPAHLESGLLSWPLSSPTIVLTPPTWTDVTPGHPDQMYCVPAVPAQDFQPLFACSVWGF